MNIVVSQLISFFPHRWKHPVQSKHEFGLYASVGQYKVSVSIDEINIWERTIIYNNIK